MIGIRHEDKSRWESRTPLIPSDVARLSRQEGIRFAVQRSASRCFRDAEFAAAGAEITDDLDGCSIILGVKEIPVELLLPEKTYLFFSHTIKGQKHNMPMLRRLMELGCQLIDYEKITDEHGRRLVFFGEHAGLAGMIDSLWALGKRLEHEGIASPFNALEPAHRYSDLDAAKAAVTLCGAQVRRDGLPEILRPFVCGFAGYGRVSSGAQAIYGLLPVRQVEPGELADLEPEARTCFKVVFREADLVEKIDAGGRFALQDYYDHPENYRSRFAPHAEHLTVLINGIYWDARYPRLLERAELARLFAPARYETSDRPRLRVIGDISCDIDGGLACTRRATDPEDPTFVYDAASGETTSGFAGPGPVVLAVDNLPCEVPVDASVHFSLALAPLVPSLARARFTTSLEESGLAPELRRATVLHRGELTPAFRYLGAHL